MKYCALCKAKYDDSVSFCAVDGEVLEDDPSAIVNTVLDGQYQIEALLGKGGMGAVFRARHILLGDRVAIKVLPREMRTNAEWLRRFRREGQAARRFRHPNAVTVHDLRTAADGTIYMVMEYIEGHTLDAELKARGRFTPAEAVAALEPIMSVLNAAHAMGVVHRDLKPENIMIGKANTDGEPTVKLLDLGIAKLSDIAGSGGGATTALTMAGQMLGTPYYMSPEQWGELPNDGNSEIDGRADIYSLALVFYELIAGSKPYSAQTLLELRKEHVSVTPRRLDLVVPDVPTAFSDVIQRAMAKDRSDRPATAGEFSKELKTALGAMAGAGFVASLDVQEDSRRGGSTVRGGRSADTVTDVNAATILTIDEVANRSQVANQTVAERATPQTSRSATAATVFEPSGLSSSATVVQPQRTPEAGIVSASAAPRRRRGPMLMAIGGVLILLLLVTGVGGFFLVNSMRAKPDTPPINSDPGKKTTGPTEGPKEVARYWIEVFSKDNGGNSAQVAPIVPIASGGSLRFHFTPTEDGFLYIVGPGDQNKPTTFLTGKPTTDLTGLSKNELRKGTDFSFPTGIKDNGEERVLGLDEKPGTESYTFIFSTTRLESPRFLDQEATAHQLTETEQSELSAFVAKYKSIAPETTTNTDDAARPFVLVKLPATAPSGNPLILDVRIQHK